MMVYRIVAALGMTGLVTALARLKGTVAAERAPHGGWRPAEPPDFR